MALLRVIAEEGRKNPQQRSPWRKAYYEEIDDTHGFAVDPALARALRDAWWQLEMLRRTDGDGCEQAETKARIAEMEKALKCPTKHSAVEAYEDDQRLEVLFHKRSILRLTEEEDAEEAHLIARLAAYRLSEEGKSQGRKFELWCRRVILAEPLNAAEECELQSLEEHYPGDPGAQSLARTGDFGQPRLRLGP